MQLETNITTATIVSLVSSTVTAILTYQIFKKNFNANEVKRLDDNLNQIIAFCIQYPYLEDAAFIAAWSVNRNNPDEKYLRYEAYCIYNFNFLDRLCRYYKFDRKKIDDFVHVKEMVRMHSAWWKNPSGEYDNLDGYSEQFRNFINSYIN